MLVKSFCWFLFFIACTSVSSQIILSTDDLENHISPEDLQDILAKYGRKVSPNESTTNKYDILKYAEYEEPTTKLPVPAKVNCLGIGKYLESLLGLFNMRPGSSDSVNTHFYFSSRLQTRRVQVYPGEQFGLEWVDFKPDRKTVMIVHGFMSHSNASWVLDLTNAFLKWADVNVIAVDWSKGGNTWKYWRAVANTRRVGSDVTALMRQLIAATGAQTKDFHFVGHSLGAHIASYVSYHLGGVARITGLDPAQPCFSESTRAERLDDSDADFVDVIHTNGRLIKKIGFGFPDPIGHADFYPNGGMQQPGCVNTSKPSWLLASGLQEAICNHGRAYVLFTESLLNNNCTFKAYRWNLTYEGVNASLQTCEDSCAEMGINALGGKSQKANGKYFVPTTEKEPYCPTELQRRFFRSDLLRDLRFGFRIDRSIKNATAPYADPLAVETTTTPKNWFRRVVNWVGK